MNDAAHQRDIARRNREQLANLKRQREAQEAAKRNELLRRDEIRRGGKK